jgi:hypothetical protein
MKYFVFLSVGFLFLNFAQAEETKINFMKFTRECIDRIDGGKTDSELCISSITSVFGIDVILSPFQTIAYITKALEDPKPTGTSHFSSSSAEMKDRPEIPEEKKVIPQLSLFFQVTDDAREYQLFKSSTPLLESAARLLKDEDLNSVSEKLLQIEAKFLQTIQLSEKSYE